MGLGAAAALHTITLLALCMCGGSRTPPGAGGRELLPPAIFVLVQNYTMALDLDVPFDARVRQDVRGAFSEALGEYCGAGATRELPRGLPNYALRQAYRAGMMAVKDRLAGMSSAGRMTAAQIRLAAPWRFDLLNELLALCRVSSEAEDQFGMTLLQLATALQLTAAVERLLLLGADVDTAHRATGLAPLHLSAKNCDAALFHLLLRHRANASAEDGSGRTPLQVARRVGCRLGKAKAHGGPVTGSALPLGVLGSLAPPLTASDGGWATHHTLPSACDLDVVHAAISSWELFEQYLSIGRPFVVHGTPMGELRQVFAKANLTRRFGATDIQVSRIPYGAVFGEREGPASIAEFLGYMEGLDPAVDREPPLYGFDYHWLQQNAAGLYGIHPPALRSLWSARAQVHQFILGPFGSGAPHHFHQDAVNTLVYGAKYWVLTPPAKSDYAKNHPSKTMAQRLRHPSARRCLQQPGDTVFVPRFWGHSVLNVAETIGLAIEFDHEACALGMSRAAETGDAGSGSACPSLVP